MMTQPVNDTASGAISAFALFMQRPDPGDYMPLPIRRFLFWVGIVGLAGPGAVLWFVSGRVIGEEWVRLAQFLMGAGVGAYVILRGMDWLGAHLNAYAERKQARLELQRRAQAAVQLPTFADLAADPNPEVRKQAARDPLCPQQQLEALAGDTHRTVRKAVALNPKATEALVLRVADPSDSVTCKELLDYWGDEAPPAVRDHILRAFA